MTGVNPSGLVLTGTRGAGKSTLARLLVDDGGFGLVRAVTTRAPRPDDDGHYKYLTKDQLRDLQAQGELVISAVYGDHHYGITATAVQDVIGGGDVPILVITPDSAIEFLSTSTSIGWVAVFIDAPDDVLNDRLRADNRAATRTDIAQRRRDRQERHQRLQDVSNDSDPESGLAAIRAALAAPEEIPEFRHP